MIEQLRLAGRDWPVPILSIKQNRIVVPAVLGFMPIIARVGAAVANQGTDPLWFASIKLTTEDFDLMCEAVYWALTKGTPGLARLEFDNLEITVEELLTALPIVAKQSGLLKQRAGDTPAGEAEAGNLSTSISSSSPIAPAPASPGPMN